MLEDFEANLPLAKESIKNNPLFSSFVADKRMRKEVLNGTTSKYLTNLQISERLPYKSDEFKPLFRFYSNHTHSTPFAVFSMNNERGMGDRNDAEVSYIETAIDFVTKYLLIATIETIGLFPDCIKELNPQKLEIVRSEFEIYFQNK